MKRIFIFLTLVFTMMQASIAQNHFELKDITSGKFSAKYVSGMRALPDGETYARISEDGDKIVSYYYKNGQQAAVLFDIKNTVGTKIQSFDDYILSPDGTKMIIMTETQSIYRRSSVSTCYIYNIGSKRLMPLSDYGKVQNPIWSNDGNLIAFVRDNNIHIVKLLYDNAEVQVTKDGEKNKIINGVPDWVYEEEFSTSSSMAFNTDGTMICWIKYDESNVKEFSLPMFKGLRPELKENALYPGAYTYKYPKAGEVNSKVSVWSYNVQSHQVRKIEVPLEEDGYIPRLLPTSDPNRMLVVTQNRHQDNLKVYSANPYTTICQMLIEDKGRKYIKEDVLSGLITTPNYIVMPCDCDEYMKIKVFSSIGTLKRTIALSKADITDVYGIDDKTGDVYFQGATPTPKDRQVYVSHANGKIECLSPKNGVTSAQFSTSFHYFLSTWSDADTPYQFAICQNSGKQLKVMEDNAELKAKLRTYPVTKKEFFTFTTSEGVKLEGWMIKPANFNPAQKYPVIMHQYSGPGSQQVKNSWTIGSMGSGALYDYYLAEQGFIIVTVDGRGTGYRGTDFEKCTYLRLGDLESKDQVETAIWLGQQSYVDKNRIGIWGWSYGGFNTLMSMSEGRGVFACGIAIAPPTNWRFYDSIYTERFMRTPRENEFGYDINPINRVQKFHGDLLLVHGLADDNVHAQNSFEFSEAMVQADKDFKELVYTNRNHSIRGGNTRNHLLRQVTSWFTEHLK